MLSSNPSSNHLEECQNEQMIKCFQEFYPDLTVCPEKPSNSLPNETIKNKTSNLTMMTQVGKQIKFTNRQFPLDDSLNSM